MFTPAHKRSCWRCPRDNLRHTFCRSTVPRSLRSDQEPNLRQKSYLAFKPVDLLLRNSSCLSNTVNFSPLSKRVLPVRFPLRRTELVKASQPIPPVSNRCLFLQMATAALKVAREETKRPRFGESRSRGVHIAYLKQLTLSTGWVNWSHGSTKTSFATSGFKWVSKSASR